MKPKKGEPLPTDIAIGQRIRSYRKARRLTQSDLGTALGVTFQQIQKYENGRNRVSGSRLVTMCNVLDTTPAQILGTKNGGGEDPFAITADTAVARALDAFRRMPKESRTHAADMVVSAMLLAQEQARAKTKTR